jgi:tetratricopeptide (TPR) repeat protein
VRWAKLYRKNYTDMNENNNGIFDSFKSFFRRIQIISWFELFEKWFAFGVKLLWVSLFVTLGLYIKKEYKKDIYYLQDFKVPEDWTKLGYTGDVTKEAIIDEIDAVKDESSWNVEETSRYKEDDNTEFLSDISVEGFNLKILVKAALTLLGKKDKAIGGYVTLSDSTQTMAIQITDQTTTKVSVPRKAPIQSLINKATLQIMRVKQPIILLSYYYAKKDSLGIVNADVYLKKHRAAISNFNFYFASVGTALYQKNYTKAEAWADSMILYYPEEIQSYTNKSNIYLHKMYSQPDSSNYEKNKKLYIEYQEKAILHNKSDGVEVPVYGYYVELGMYVSRWGDHKKALTYFEKANKIKPPTAYVYNQMAYVYFRAKNYKKADEFVDKAIEKDPENAEYIDSKAEIYSVAGKDSLAVIYLQKALKATKKSKSVTVEAYRQDPRWQRLLARKDYQKLIR